MGILSLRDSSSRGEQALANTVYNQDVSLTPATQPNPGALRNLLVVSITVDQLSLPFLWKAPG